MQDLTAIFSAQQSAFRQSEPPLYSERITNLKKLLDAIDRFQDRLFEAISADFASEGCGGRSRYETMIAETQIARSDLKYTIKNLRKWMRPKRVSTPIHLLPSNGKILVQPLGVVGIMSPFNYPFQLTIVAAQRRPCRRQPGYDQALRAYPAHLKTAGGNAPFAI